MNALFGYGHIGRELFDNRRTVRVSGIDWLGTAIGFDAGKEQIAALTVDRSFKTERAGVRGDLISAGYAADRIGDAYRGRGGGISGRRRMFVLARISGQAMSLIAASALVPNSIEAVTWATSSS